MPAATGYQEFKIESGELLKTITIAGTSSKGAKTVERQPDGTTLVGLSDYEYGDGQKAPAILILDRNDEIKDTIIFPGMEKFRDLRTTWRHTILLTISGELVETSFDGDIVRRVPLAGKPFKAVMLPDTTVLVTVGPSSRKLYRVLPNDDVELVIDGDSLNEGGFVGFHLLSENEIVIACWLGHGAGHAGTVAYQYGPDGNVVWSYQRSQSTFVEIIILDNLDTELLHNERNGIMAPTGASTGLLKPDDSSACKLTNSGFSYELKKTGFMHSTPELRHNVFLINGRVLPKRRDATNVIFQVKPPCR